MNERSFLTDRQQMKMKEQQINLEVTYSCFFSFSPSFLQLLHSVLQEMNNTLINMTLLRMQETPLPWKAIQLRRRVEDSPDLMSFSSKRQWIEENESQLEILRYKDCRLFRRDWRDSSWKSQLCRQLLLRVSNPKLSLSLSHFLPLLRASPRNLL